MNLHNTDKEEPRMSHKPTLRLKLARRVDNGNYNNHRIILYPDVWYKANWYTPKKRLIVYLPETMWERTIVDIKDVSKLEEL